MVYVFEFTRNPRKTQIGVKWEIHGLLFDRGGILVESVEHFGGFGK